MKKTISIGSLSLTYVDRLKERTSEIENLREKLKKELNYLTTENENLQKSKYELDHAIVQLKRPEVHSLVSKLIVFFKSVLILPKDIASHNLRSREYRQGIDQVDDVVQVALRTEIQEIRRVREEMHQLLEIVKEFSTLIFFCIFI